MSEGNGVDIGAIYMLLREVAEAIRKVDRRVDDVSSKLEGMRQALTHYHSTVLGHGILITEIDERVRRIEQHLNLPPAA